MLFKNIMYQLLANALCITSLAAASCSTEVSNCPSGCTQSQNLWQPHAFSVSISRELLLEKQAWIKIEETGKWHGTFGLGFEFMQNFSSNSSCCKSLGSMPFWSENQNNIMSFGSNNGTFNLDAYQLGLGPITSSGTIKLDPKIYQTGADVFLYAGAHQTQHGLFAKIHGPVGIMKINPCLNSTGNAQSVEYDAFQIQNSFTDIPAPYENIVQAFAGGKSAGDLQALKFGRIHCSQSSNVRFGDLALALGYNLYADEFKHIGIAIRCTIPTGNKADGVYILSPIFGRNGHWAAGGELIGHWRIELQQENRHLDIWFDGTLEHMFASKHVRSFDLKKNGLGSKYLLLANYANNDYQNEIINAINATTLPVQSIFDMEGNFAIMLDAHHNNWSAGIGYEGWGRSCEELKIDPCCAQTINLNNYAVLGRQNVRDGLCDPKATINKSLNEGSIWADDATLQKNRIPAELDKVIDIDGQRAHAAYTNKIFGQLAYTKKNSHLAPYVAISGGAEFNNSYNNAASFWTLGAQCGLAF